MAAASSVQLNPEALFLVDGEKTIAENATLLTQKFANAFFSELKDREIVATLDKQMQQRYFEDVRNFVNQVSCKDESLFDRLSFAISFIKESVQKIFPANGVPAFRYKMYELNESDGKALEGTYVEKEHADSLKRAIDQKHVVGATKLLNAIRFNPNILRECAEIAKRDLDEGESREILTLILTKYGKNGGQPIDARGEGNITRGKWGAVLECALHPGSVPLIRALMENVQFNQEFLDKTLAHWTKNFTLLERRVRLQTDDADLSLEFAQKFWAEDLPALQLFGELLRTKKESVLEEAKEGTP